MGIHWAQARAACQRIKLNVKCGKHPNRRTNTYMFAFGEVRSELAARI